MRRNRVTPEGISHTPQLPRGLCGLYHKGLASTYPGPRKACSMQDSLLFSYYANETGATWWSMPSVSILHSSTTQVWIPHLATSSAPQTQYQLLSCTKSQLIKFITWKWEKLDNLAISEPTEHPVI